MRHRHRLVTAALAGTLALAGCGDRPSGDPASAGASTARPGTAIADDFPLAAGMGGPEDSVPTSRTGTGLRDLELCGTSPLRGVGTRDRLVADDSGGEAADTRELVLLGAPEDASRLAGELVALVTDCAEPDAAPAGGDTAGVETRTEVLASPFGPGPAATLLQTHTVDGRPATGATVVHVVPAGAAVLVTSTYGRWTGRAQDAVDATVEPLRETVAALEVFGDATEAPETPEPTAAEPVEVPAGFPLDVGLPADGGDYDVTPPTEGGPGMGEVEVCGHVVWPHGRTADAGATRRLVSGALGPEHGDHRELVVHADADAAVAAMTTVREAVGSCDTVDNQVWTPLDRDTGFDTVTFALTYDDGLGSSVFQVTRVGSARLLVATYGEGSLASLDGQADEVTGTTETILPAMCVFTRTGC